MREAMARMALVRTTLPAQAQANALADALVSAGLAACVHVTKVRSTYIWQGRQEETDEWLVEARTLTRRAAQAEARMLEGHPYEVPLVEMLKCNVSGAYLAWAKGART